MRPSRMKRKPRIPEGEFEAVIGMPKTQELMNINEKWHRVTVPFIIKRPRSKDIIVVNFYATIDSTISSNLILLFENILGNIRPTLYNLDKLEGRTVKALVVHRIDKKGNTWENMIAARKNVRRRNRHQSLFK